MKRGHDSIVLRALLLLGTIGLAGIASMGTAGAQVNMGSAANYAVLALGGTNSHRGQYKVYQSGTVIDGNVGGGPFADSMHDIDAMVNGRVDHDLTTSAPVVTGTVTGGVHQISMAQAISDARAASAYVSGLGPTQTFSTLTSGQTLFGGGGMNVVRVTGSVALSGGSTTFNIHGSSSDFFVIQLTVAQAPSAHSLTLSGVQMSLSGGITANRILWNMHGAGGGIVIKADARVYGTFLAPDRGILSDHGNITGALI